MLAVAFSVTTHSCVLTYFAVVSRRTCDRSQAPYRYIWSTMCCVSGSFSHVNAASPTSFSPMVAQDCQHLHGGWQEGWRAALWGRGSVPVGALCLPSWYRWILLSGREPSVHTGFLVEVCSPTAIPHGNRIHEHL